MIRYAPMMIKMARKEQGLTQEALIRKIGEYRVSLRTLRRIERGSSTVTPELIDELLDYFGIYLIYDIRDEYEDRVMQEALERASENMTVRDCINEATAKIAEYRTFYHNEESGLKDYHIKTLADFIIYYPLIDKKLMDESIGRIGGDMHNRSYYVLEQLEYLYNSIPASKAKDAADMLAKGVLTGDGPDEELYGEYYRILDSRPAERSTGCR